MKMRRETSHSLIELGSLPKMEQMKSLLGGVASGAIRRRTEPVASSLVFSSQSNQLGRVSVDQLPQQARSLADPFPPPVGVCSPNFQEKTSH